MSAQKALIIKAKGGLGNRMLSAVTGLVLAQLRGRTPYIDWRDGMYLPAGENLYPLLFDASWMSDLEAFDDSTRVAPGIWSGRMTDHPSDLIHAEFPNSHQDPLLYRKLSVPLTGADAGEPVAVYWSYISKLKRLERPMSIDPAFAGKSLGEVTQEMLSRYFQPPPEISGVVDTALPESGPQTIGVHVRFTDRKVPLSKIMRALNHLTKEQPDARIFLATDSAEARRAVLRKYPDAIEIDKALDQSGAPLHVASGQFDNPLAEARNALADMVALSRCDWLVHSSHSTFSVTAALMGGIPKPRQIDVDRFNLKVRLKQFVQARI